MTDRQPPTPPQIARREDALPTVEPPSASFLAQLFLIPFMIVSLVVLVWFALHWLAQMGNSPVDMVARLESLDGDRKHDHAWQIANDLAVVLAGRDNAAVRGDSELAKRLAAILERECRRDDASPERLELRMYLCTALGQFTVPDGLPALVLASGPQQPPTIRQVAMEAMARLGDTTGVGVATLRDTPAVISALHDAAQTFDNSTDNGSASGAVRSRAAFALGVIGGPEATNDLVTLLTDPFDDARRNAAAGLARQGDSRAIPELLRMLELRRPADDANKAKSAAKLDAMKSEDWMRHVVWGTALGAVATLVSQSDLDKKDLESLHSAVERLSIDAGGAIRLQAKGVAKNLASRTAQKSK